jgi:hypothetical protein
MADGDQPADQTGGAAIRERQVASRKEAPGTLAQAAVSHGLGMPRYLFRTGVDAIAWWGVFMLLLVGAFCVMMTMIIKGESGLAYASPFIGLGALCFLGALAIPLARVLAPVEWCQVYEYGFVYQRGARPPVAGCWDEITLFNRFDIKIVRNGMTMGYNSSATIDVPAGRVELTKHFPAAKQLIDLLQDDYYKARVHLALLAVQDGETKAFGAWQVSLDGLAHANGIIPWTEIKKIDVLGPTVEVYLRGELKPAMKVPLDDLHEPTVLLTVLDRLSRAAR